MAYISNNCCCFFPGPRAWNPNEVEPKIFVSYHWDMQPQVGEIRRILEAHGFPCWAGISPTMSGQVHHSHSNLGCGSTHSMAEGQSETFQSKVRRYMKAASTVISCITPKYMQSDSCVKDLTLAELLHKPIIPVLLQFCPWPPESAPLTVRKILVKYTPVDLSNDKLFRKNLHLLVERIRRLLQN